MKKLVGIALGLGLSLTFLSVSSVSSAAPQIAGTKCQKVGALRTAKSVKFQCVRSAKGLRWVLASASNKKAISVKLPTTTFSTVPLTCETGGKCAVGDKGPGGGIVFYVHPDDEVFVSSGSDCNTKCRYLEAAPVTWSKDVPEQELCKYPANTELNSSPTPICAWSGNTGSEVGLSAQARSIGSGSSNTTAIIADDATPGRAASVARAYRGGNKTDWHLPSIDELEEFAKQIGLVGIGLYEQCRPNGRADCVKVYLGSFWSSTENSLKPLLPNLKLICWGEIEAWSKLENIEVCTNTTSNRGVFKEHGLFIRPVRAFSPLSGGSLSVSVPSSTASTVPLYTDTEITSVNNLLDIQDCRLRDSTLNPSSAISSGFPRPEVLRPGVGQLAILVIPVSFTDLIFTSNDAKALEATLSKVNTFYSSMSYGRASVKSTIAPSTSWVDIGETVEQNGLVNTSLFWDAAPFYRKVLDIYSRTNSLDGYDSISVVTSRSSRIYSGRALSVYSTGKSFSGTLVLGNDTLSWGTIAHELGHAWLGFEDLYLFAGGSPLGTWDTMSSGESEFSGWSRFLAGWIEPNWVRCANPRTPTRHYLSALNADKSEDKPRMLVLPLNSQSAIIAELRTPTSLQTSIKSSTLVVYRVDTRFDSGNGPIKLIGTLNQNGGTLTSDGVKITVKGINASGVIVEISN